CTSGPGNLDAHLWVEIQGAPSSVTGQLILLIYDWLKNNLQAVRKPGCFQRKGSDGGRSGNFEIDGSQTGTGLYGMRKCQSASLLWQTRFSRGCAVRHLKSLNLRDWALNSQPIWCERSK
ncbi:hypothetical protein PO909_022508, partial [Leuciscus waleckii]